AVGELLHPELRAVGQFVERTDRTILSRRLWLSSCLTSAVREIALARSLRRGTQRGRDSLPLFVVDPRRRARRWRHLGQQAFATGFARADRGNDTPSLLAVAARREVAGHAALHAVR